MTNKERSVEEIVEEFVSKLQEHKLRLRRIHEQHTVSDIECVIRGEENLVDWLTQTLQAERQKQEEVVEAERERIKKNLNDLLKANDYYGGSPVLGIDDVNKALTQPNNK
jgi:hypothetical protein